MDAQEQDQYHLAWSRDLVAALAPNELPLFRVTAAAYQKNPQAVFANKPGQAPPLAFGDTGEAVALTPAILAIMGPVVAFVAQEAAASAPVGADSAALVSTAFTPPAVALQRRNALLETLNTHFSMEELKTLSFRLNIDYDQLDAGTKEQFARELILYCERHGLVAELLQECRTARPRLDWPAPAAEPRVAWSADQLRRLREMVLQTAQRANLPEAAGEEIADKLVLSLVAT